MHVFGNVLAGCAAMCFRRVTRLGLPPVLHGMRSGAAHILLACFFLFLASCQGRIPLENSGSVDLGHPASPVDSVTAGNLDFVYDAIDTLFGTYVGADRGLVDYEGINADPLLKQLIDTIAVFDMAGIETSADSLAFWINAYNVLVIYHLETAFDRQNQATTGFPLFSTPFAIAGERISLDDLEKYNSKRIKKFNEPRTHFAVVCGALGCPPLLNHAFRGDRLYAQLDERTQSFINDSRFNAPPHVSSLFSWYAAYYRGFVRDPTSPSLLSEQTGATVSDFIGSYLEESVLLTDQDLQYLPYDWEVNEGKG